jgi:hypothetical protein
MNYFATPVKIGRGAYETPEFPDPKTLLAHLDYLGIDRALVYATEAVDYSPVNGNKLLIERLEPYRDRLFPVWVLTPTDFYEYGTLDWLKGQLRAGNRACFINPELSRFRIRELERLLLALDELRPVIFVDSDYRTAPDMIYDIEYLTEKCPGCHFVIQKEMWGGFHRVLDLMWRRRNVGLDISWLHMRDTIELVIEEFGLERLFFGIGHTAQYGAALAALAHARITDAEREAIAHGNLETLLGIAPAAGKLAHEPEFADKPLWRAFKAGKPIHGVKAYDIHTHVEGPVTRGWVIRESDPAQTVERMVDFMDRHGIAKTCLIGEAAMMGDPVAGNRETAELARRHPGRFMGYVVFNPHYARELDEKTLDGFFRDPFFVGFKLLASYWQVPYDDPRYTPVWEYAERHHLPILMHTWGREAEPFRAIAPRYPHAKFILGHTGGSDSGRRLSVELAQLSPNIYLDYCAAFCSHIPWCELLTQVDKTRLVFGSDAGPHNEAYELGAFLSMPVPDAELVPILAENFDRILADRR